MGSSPVEWPLSQKRVLSAFRIRGHHDFIPAWAWPIRLSSLDLQQDRRLVDGSARLNHVRK